MLPANITQIPTLRELYAAAQCPRLRLASLGSMAHVCRNVTFNLLHGGVSEIARMNGPPGLALPPLPAPSLLLGSQLPPPLDNLKPASRGARHALKIAEDAIPDAMVMHAPKAPSAGWPSFLDDHIGPYRPSLWWLAVSGSSHSGGRARGLPNALAKTKAHLRSGGVCRLRYAAPGFQAAGVPRSFAVCS